MSIINMQSVFVILFSILIKLGTCATYKKYGCMFKDESLSLNSETPVTTPQYGTPVEPFVTDITFLTNLRNYVEELASERNQKEFNSIDMWLAAKDAFVKNGTPFKDYFTQFRVNSYKDPNSINTGAVIEVFNKIASKYPELENHMYMVAVHNDCPDVMLESTKSYEEVQKTFLTISVGGAIKFSVNGQEGHIFFDPSGELDTAFLLVNSLDGIKPVNLFKYNVSSSLKYIASYKENTTKYALVDLAFYGDGFNVVISTDIINIDTPYCSSLDTTDRLYLVLKQKLVRRVMPDKTPVTISFEVDSKSRTSVLSARIGDIFQNIPYNDQTSGNIDLLNKMNSLLEKDNNNERASNYLKEINDVLTNNKQFVDQNKQLAESVGLQPPPSGDDLNRILECIKNDNNLDDLPESEYRLRRLYFHKKATNCFDRYGELSMC